MVISIKGERSDDNQCNTPAPTRRFFITTKRYRLARAGPVRANQVLSSFLASAVDFNFEHKSFAHGRAAAILGKRRNMDEDLRAADRWRNEAEAALVIPSAQHAFDWHFGF